MARTATEWISPVGHGNWIGVNPVFGPETADQGNVISGNDGSSGVGVWITPSAAGNVIAGNLIGTDPTGTMAVPNNRGIAIKGSGNLIGNYGGTDQAIERNIISGNTTGIDIYTGAASGNLIAGNYIGTDITGTSAIANGTGILIRNAASDNTIGGASAADRNLISGNTAAGVEITNSGSSANVIAGNYIGTNVSGTAALANGGDGIDDFASNNTIGGSTSGAGNVISGNSGDGVQIQSANDVLVIGNLIGTNAADTAAIANYGLAGVMIYDANSNTIGGTSAAPVM